MISIKVENLFHIYQAGNTVVVALRGINLTLESGKIIAIVGPTGSGKTTLLKILRGELTQSGGLISSEPHKIAYVDQFSYMHFQLSNTVEEVIRMYYAPSRHREVLTAVGLENKLNSRVDKLSFGEAQRLFFQISSHMDPDIFLIDEATAQLDSTNSAIIFNRLRHLADRGKLVIIATHDNRVIERADQVIRIENGYIESTMKEDKEGNIHFSVELHSGNALKIPDYIMAYWNFPRTVDINFDESSLQIKPGEGMGVKEVNYVVPSEEESSKIQVNGFEIKIPDGRVIKLDTDATFRSGTISAVVGPSGSGKSTFLDWAFGELDPALCGSGEIRYDNLSERDVIYISQKNFIPRDMVITDVIDVFSEQSEHLMLDELLDYFQIDRTEGRRVSELSGGQKYLLALCIALSKKPRALVMDETLANLDMDTKKNVMMQIERMKESNRIIIIASHERFIIDRCDYTVAVRPHEGN